MNAIVAPITASITRLQAAFTQYAGASQPVRQHAFANFLRQGFPTTRDEQWKYTNLRRLEAREFGIGQPDAPYVPQQPPLAEAHQLVFVDGHYRNELSTPPTTAGLHVNPLSELQHTDSNALDTALSITANEPCRFVSLNTALTQDGVLIELDANTTLDKPLLLNFIWSDQPSSLMAHPRVIIRAGQHSKLVVIEQYQGNGITAHFSNAVTTLELADGAQLEHCRIQNENSHSFHIGMLHAKLAAQAALTSHHINFGAVLARMDINVYLQGAGAGVTLNGLQFATDTQHHDSHLRIEHCVPHTHSNQDYRGIADQRGRVVFNGKVMVHEKAIKTDAQQSSRNLLLANTAEIDTKPELEIYNDDVKCAHGATVGQLDATALFYLRSRGLDEPQARALLTHAFADHIIAQLPLAVLREQLTAAGHARFGSKLDTGL
ncbi:MAG: Fe-S cluster assembly protein SufD [Steroidobacteraceae bacterium]